MNNTEVKPTPLAVAQILESTLQLECPYPESRPTLMSMLRTSPQTKGLLDELTRPREDGRSLMDLAKLILSISDPDLQDSYETALWVIQQSEEGQRVYERLQNLGEDLGDVIAGNRWPVTVLHRNEEVDRILAADDDWDDPADIVDPVRDMVSAETYREWLSICAARQRRGEGDQERLRAVVKKIRAAGRRASHIGRVLKKVEELEPMLQWLGMAKKSLGKTDG